MQNRETWHSMIFGCGDVGRRIAKHLMQTRQSSKRVGGYVNTVNSRKLARSVGVECTLVDLDSAEFDVQACDKTELYYTVAPQKYGIQDQRSRRIIDEFTSTNIRPTKVVIISTTGVYGDCEGEWVSEQSPTRPQTERGQRRLDSERVWLAWGREQNVDVVVLRVPGIYAYSRLPRERLKRKIPVVRASECGFTNRIHADDLARICIAAMQRASAGDIYNVTDGNPGKICEYLQAAAKVLGYDPLPEISMQQAQSELSTGMLSYLSESRKISNQKLLDELGIELLYPDFNKGILN